MTASEPSARAFAMSPLRVIPPSAITCTYRPPDSSRYSLRAAATSAIAVAIGTFPPSTAAEANQDSGGACPHEVQRRGVGGAAAHDHGNVELVDEVLEVQRLSLAGDVLGRNGRAADDHEV